MTSGLTKTCRGCGATKPIEQFRLVKPPARHPTWKPSRFHLCRDCERETNRVRLGQQYHDDPVYREKQIANAAVQRQRQARRRSERSTEG